MKSEFPFRMPRAKDSEVYLAAEMIDFGSGPEEVLVFYPKNKLITKEQRQRAERDYKAKGTLNTNSK